MIPILLTLILHRAPQTDWSTTYERSGYVATGRYQEAVDYCKRLEKASPYAHVLRFGTSPEGRPMIALLLSRDREFTPAAAHRSVKPLIFVNNGIHSGEIEGKDACLLLARDILITGRERQLLDGVNLLIVPVFGLDAHERFGPFNRINQNGPREMGWRATSTNLNLNRDFVKADAVEMRAMIRLIHTWKPDFFFDNHTTDGGNWRYVVHPSVPVAPTLAEPVADWSRQMLDAVSSRVEKDGFLTGPYFGNFDPAHPDRGISISDYSPRYSNGYLLAINRPSMLVETHMLKPYRQRVEATYSIVKRTIEYCAKTTLALRAAISSADNADRNLQPGTPVVLEASASSESRPYTFKGYKYTPYHSEISGAMTPAWDTSSPVDIPTRLHDRFVPGLTIPAPAAYAIPPQWTDVIDLIHLHGFTTLRTRHEVTDSFETYRFENVSFPTETFESRSMPNFTSVKITETRTLPAGTVVVPINQPGARLLMHILEPAGPDSLMHWGFFNVVFEWKEYFEDYAMEPVARKMLDSDPKLKTEFEERLKDPKFAADPHARLDFFYQRSPYADSRLNKYPIVRLTAEQLRHLK